VAPLQCGSNFLPVDKLRANFSREPIQVGHRPSQGPLRSRVANQDLILTARGR
jgi:hypothetical protein